VILVKKSFAFFCLPNPRKDYDFPVGKIFCHPVARSYFCQYLERARNVENSEFLKDYYAYLKLRTFRDRKKKSEDIIAKFLNSTSRYELNLSSAVKKHVQHLFNAEFVNYKNWRRHSEDFRTVTMDDVESSGISINDYTITGIGGDLFDQVISEVASNVSVHVDGFLNSDYFLSMINKDMKIIGDIGVHFDAKKLHKIDITDTILMQSIISYNDVEFFKILNSNVFT